MLHFFKRYGWGIAILLVMAVGAYMRLHDIAGYMTFLGDEGRDALVVKRMIVDHKWTLLGPTASVGGFFLGPIYYYFMLPFLWAWGLNPVGPAVMVALFGTATIGLVFVVGSRLLNRWAGFFAASLYAISPLVIGYSRSSWNPNVVPFFAILLIYFLWRLKEKNSMRDALGAGVALGIGLQLHYLFSFLFVLVGLWVSWVALRKKQFGTFLYVLGGFLVGYSPFLAFELRHGFPNTQSVTRFILEGKDTGFTIGTYFQTVHDVIFRSFGRLVLRFPQEDIWPKIAPTALGAWRIGTYIFAVGSIVLLFLRRFKVKSQETGSILMLLWIGVVAGMFGFYHKAIYDYYFGIIFPLPFLFAGYVLSVPMKHRIFRWFAVAAWIGLLYLNWLGQPFQYPPNNQLAQAKRIADTALLHTDGKPFNFALVTGNNSDHTYRYFFEMANRAPVTIENTQVDPERKTVTDQLIVICEIAPCNPLGHPLWEIAGFGRAEVKGEWYVPFVTIMKLVHYEEKKP